MDKYAQLEQALGDPALAIISDGVSTLSELTRVGLKYKVLPKKQKRYSDYYSNKFLGRSVPDMYELMRDRLSAESEFLSELNLPSEAYLHSEPDLYYKEEAFNAGETNICFILGHSGSGKSMMARSLEGDEIDHIELDDLLLTKDHFTMDELQAYSDLIYRFFAGEGAKYYIGFDERDAIPKEDYEDRVFLDFVAFATAYAKERPEKKFIIDGIWLYLYFDDPSVFDDYAVFIKGTSFLKSKIRAMKRELQRDREAVEERKQMFGREVRNYLLDEEKIDRYRSYFGSRPETVYREEDSDAARQAERLLFALNEIDRCFVLDDADGVRAVMKQAETDPALNNWSKLRILNEGASALLDLRR